MPRRCGRPHRASAARPRDRCPAAPAAVRHPARPPRRHRSRAADPRSGAAAATASATCRRPAIGSRRRDGIDHVPQTRDHVPQTRDRMPQTRDRMPLRTRVRRDRHLVEIDVEQIEASSRAVGEALGEVAVGGTAALVASVLPADRVPFDGESIVRRLVRLAEAPTPEAPLCIGLIPGRRCASACSGPLAALSLR